MPNYEQNEIQNWEHDHRVVAKRVIGVESDLQLRVDDLGTTLYVGQGARGLALSADGWLLTKYTIGDTTVSSMTAIDTWNNRASASYA